MNQRKSELTTLVNVAQLLAMVLTVGSLYFARDVFIPVALGLLLSFLLSPIVNQLQRWGVNNIAAVVMTASITFILLAGVFTLLGREVSQLLTELPQHKEELIAKARGLAGLTSGVGGSLDKLASEVTEAMEDEEPAEADDPLSTETPSSEGASMTDTSVTGDRSLMQRWTDRLLPSNPGDKNRAPNDGKTAKTALYVQPIQKEPPVSAWATTAITVLGPLTTAGLVTVFALFLLIYREDLRDRIISVVSNGDYVATTEALDEAGGRISRYLVAQSIVNVSYGVTLTIGLLIIGATLTDTGSFPNAVLWGLLATCLRFVPYLGPVIAAIFPLTIALAVFPGYSVVIAVLVLIVAMELLSNNVLEPWLYGASTGISAVAVIIAAVFWGWLWGPVGLLLSTPLTVCLVVLGHYVPRFKIFSTLLGEDVEIKISMRFYQRLLAGDAFRARELLLQHADENGLDENADEVLVPALKRMRYDRQAEYMNQADSNRLLALTGGLIEDLRSHLFPETEELPKTAKDTVTKDTAAKDTATEDTDAMETADSSDAMSSVDETTSQQDTVPEHAATALQQLPVVVGCAAHHVSESLVLNLLRLGGLDAFKLQSVSEDTTPQDISKTIAEEEPAAVVIVVVPPGGFAQARYLCKSIRTAGYTGPVIIACLGKFKHFDRLFVKARKAGVTSMTTSYSQTRAKIESFLRAGKQN